MTPDPLLNRLLELEVELHQPATRRDPHRLAELLHDEFLEFGRSGRAYTKADQLATLPLEEQVPAVWAQDFEIRRLSEQVALLTYRSAHIGQEGKLERHTLRASLWKLTPGGWQMVFHQGTATEAFDRSAT